MPQHSAPTDGAADTRAHSNGVPAYRGGFFTGNPVCAPIAKALASRAAEKAANDNAEFTRDSVANDQMLRAALRHFAEHGLGAAREARAQAENAFFTGDRQAYNWWLGITRTLDRRMAAQAAQLLPDNANGTSPA
ncbi:hypothetical protein [uncultured Erythrobacter sp.]|uniref:hypothetical protein n=1 Tax=uncultured Erythrobacter sp. TaxID=263913 RepID=UPI002609C44B|nr:hypothetical protein [uncultured Erythrobacter sp.]